jgi:hypothetical protein
MRTFPSKPAHRASSIAQVNRQHALHFSRGGLHRSTGTPAGQKISAAKHAEAASGKLGKLAEKQERFYRNVLR